MANSGAGTLHVEFSRYRADEVRHAPNSRISKHGVYLVGRRRAYLIVWFRLR